MGRAWGQDGGVKMEVMGTRLVWTQEWCGDMGWRQRSWIWGGVGTRWQRRRGWRWRLSGHGASMGTVWG